MPQSNDGKEIIEEITHPGSIFSFFSFYLLQLYCYISIVK